MQKNELSKFGKEIKIALIERDKTQNWLIEKVRIDTGLFFDPPYLRRIMTGQLSTPKIVNSICEILGLGKDGGNK